MKRASEGAFGKALREVEVVKYVYRPPDARAAGMVTNPKPCDYMVWTGERFDERCAWFEAKDVDAVDAFPRGELRPSQLQGIRDARRVGVDYRIAVYWRRHRSWTISDATAVLDWFEANPDATSIKRDLLQTRFGVETSPRLLSSTLKAVLLGEV